MLYTDLHTAAQAPHERENYAMTVCNCVTHTLVRAWGAGTSAVDRISTSIAVQVARHTIAVCAGGALGDTGNGLEERDKARATCERATQTSLQLTRGAGGCTRAVIAAANKRRMST